jgi:hypothetical protein
MAGPSSLRSCAFEIPTDDPRFAGFTNTGYFSLLSTSLCTFFGALKLAAQHGHVLHDRQSRGAKQRLHDVFIHARGRAEHARAHVGDVGQFEQALNGAVFAEGSVQHGEDDIDVNGAVGGAQIRIADLHRSGTAPVRLRVAPVPEEPPPTRPCQHRRSRSSLRIARPQRCCCVARAPSPACFSPFNNLSACSAVSQRPSFVMPMGTTSYFVLSIAFRTDAADSNDTSCSPLRPPKRMPTRSFAITFQSGARPCFPSIAAWFRASSNHEARDRRERMVGRPFGPLRAGSALSTCDPCPEPDAATAGSAGPAMCPPVTGRVTEFLLDVLLQEVPLRAQRHLLDGELGFLAGIVHANRQFFVLETRNR